MNFGVTSKLLKNPLLGNVNRDYVTIRLYVSFSMRPEYIAHILCCTVDKIIINSNEYIQRNSNER